MASITKKSTSARWIACFTDAAGVQRQRSTGVPDQGTPGERAEARRRAQDIASEFEAAARGDRTEAQIRKTITELYNRVNPAKRLEWATAKPFLLQWLERVAVRKTSGTHTRYGTIVHRFIAGLGPKESAHLGDLTTEDFQNFLDSELSSGKRAGTLRIEIKVLSAAMGYALRQGLIITNPVSAVEIPDDASESKKPFTIDQVRALVAACAPAAWSPGDKIAKRLEDWRTVIIVGAFTGLRLGDACNLRWRDVKMDSKTIEVRPEKTRRKAKDIIIPLHPFLESRLSELRGHDEPDANLSPGLAGEKIGGRSGLSRQFQRIMEVAGIENMTLAGGEEGGGRRLQAFGFHSLRHFYVSALANAGVAQDLRMALAGHSSKDVNEIYTHRGIESLRGAIDRLPSL